MDGISFQSKSQQLLTDLREWHMDHFGNRDTQLKNCKKVVLFFDQIKEKRPLDQR